MTQIDFATMIDAAPAAAGPPLTPRDIAFGFLMPPVCIGADLLAFGLSREYPALVVFAVLGGIALLVSVWVPLRDGGRAVVGGALAAAGVGAVPIGVALLPIFGIGILAAGIADVFVRRGLAMTPAGSRHGSATILGAVIVLGIPIALQIADSKWYGPQWAKLGADDPARVAEALDALVDYPLELGRTRRLVCFIHRRLVSDEKLRGQQPDVRLRDAIERYLQQNPGIDCRRHVK